MIDVFPQKSAVQNLEAHSLTEISIRKVFIDDNEAIYQWSAVLLANMVF